MGNIQMVRECTAIYIENTDRSAREIALELGAGHEMACLMGDAIQQAHICMRQVEILGEYHGAPKEPTKLANHFYRQARAMDARLGLDFGLYEAALDAAGVDMAAAAVWEGRMK